MLFQRNFHTKNGINTYSPLKLGMMTNNSHHLLPILGIDDLIPLREAAQTSELSADHLRRLVERGDLWGKKIGRNWVTSKQAILDYIAKDRQPGRKAKKSPKDLDK